MDKKDLFDEQVYEQARADEFIWQRARALEISRRRLVQLLAAGAGAATVGILPSRKTAKVAQAQTPEAVAQAKATEAIVKPARPDWFYKIKSNLEMRWETMYNRGYLVPNELFFVRNNNPTPRIDPATWKLEVYRDGVSRPMSFSYDEILTMSSVSVIRAIECAGNGRSFYKTAYGKEASGTQWKLGGSRHDLQI
ncbi:MAG: molybdopterin-dependent oxidoreductase [Xenococcaceae cyanobacterium]